MDELNIKKPINFRGLFNYENDERIPRIQKTERVNTRNVLRKY